MNRLDRAISYLSPTWGAKRAASRLILDASNYQGARSSRMTYNWSTGSESADAAIDGELETLRERSRDLNRNNAIAAGITDTFCQNVVKTGIKPQAAPDYEAIGISEAQAAEFTKQAERCFKKWEPTASANGRLSFSEIQALCTRQMIESGEFLSVRRAIRSNRRPYMLALDVMEPDRLETPGSDYGQPDVRYGVRKNQYGEPLAYSIRKTHPGDNWVKKDDGAEHKWVSAYDPRGRPLVFHLFPTLRPGQTRGVPFFAPVVEKFKVLADYLEAELVAARVAACFAAFVKVSNPYAAAVGRSDTTNDDNQRLENLEPGVIEYLGNDEDIVFSDPKRPGTTFDQFVERILRMIGSSLGLPYELVLKDFSKTNYSSARAALLQAYRVFQVWQGMLITHLCQPVWEILIEEAWLRGEIIAPDFRKYQWEYTRAQWITPGWAWVDPLKEAQAHQLTLEMRTKTRADICAEQGEDWEAKAEQASREQRKFKDLRLIDEEFAYKPRSSKRVNE